MVKKIRSYGYKGILYLDKREEKYPVFIDKYSRSKNDGYLHDRFGKGVKYYHPLEIIIMAFENKFELLSIRTLTRAEWIEIIMPMQLITISPILQRKYLIVMADNVDSSKEGLKKENSYKTLEKPYDINKLVQFMKAYIMNMQLSD